MRSGESAPWIAPRYRAGYWNRSCAPGRERWIQQHAQGLVAIRIVSGEADLGKAPRDPRTAGRPHRVVQGRLRGQGQGIHPLVAAALGIERDAVRVGGEDVIEQPRDPGAPA
jgi:hypothetical protein